MTSDPRWAGAMFFGGAALLLVALLLLLFRSGSAGAGGSAVSVGGLIEWLTGKKTYLVGIALLVTDQALDFGVLTEATAWKIQKTLAAVLAFTLAAAQNRALQGQARAEVIQKVAAVKVAEVAQAVEQVAATVEAPKPAVTPPRVEPPAPPPQPAPVPNKDFS